MAAAAIPLAMAGIQGLAGLFGGRSSTTTVNGTQDHNNSTTYQYSPDQQLLMRQIMQQYQDQINGNPFGQEYQAQGIQNINKTSDASQQAIQNMLAQRGLSFSPAAATSLTQNRVGQQSDQTQFLNNLPLLRYQQKTQALGQAGSFLNGQRVNSNETGRTTSQQTQKGSGNMLGGLFAGVGSALADTLGKRFANQK